MNIDFQNLVELMKIISDHNENPVRIEKKLMQNDSAENKTKSYMVQLGDSTLIFSNTNTSNYSESQQQEFFDELDQQKKTYQQIWAPQEPLASSKSELSTRGGFTPATINMETMSRRLSQEYREYQQKFNSPPLSKRFDTKNYDEEKFKDLAKDPRANKEVFHKTTCDEARTALHSEMERIVYNVQRIDQPITNLQIGRSRF